MARIRGITVNLYEQTIIGYDAFNAPIYSDEATMVDNVLVGQPTDDELTSSVSLYGKKIAYMLGIPKGDTHDWAEKTVEWVDAYGITHKCQTFGFPITGIEANLPARVPWHMKVRCEEIG